MSSFSEEVIARVDYTFFMPGQFA